MPLRHPVDRVMPFQARMPEANDVPQSTFGPGACLAWLTLFALATRPRSASKESQPAPQLALELATVRFTGLSHEDCGKGNSINIAQRPSWSIFSSCERLSARPRQVNVK